MAASKLTFLLVTINLACVMADLFGNVKYDMDKGRHSIKEGTRQPGDITLYSELPVEKGQRFPPKHVGNEYCYPPKGAFDQVTITSYEVTDQDTGDDGGLAFDESGGVGQNQVCVFLKTQYGKSYHFKIEVFGFRGNGNNGMGMGYGNNGGPKIIPIMDGPNRFGGSGNNFGGNGFVGNGPNGYSNNGYNNNGYNNNGYNDNGYGGTNTYGGNQGFGSSY